MKKLMSGLAMALLISGISSAQVTIEADDIPTAPGTLTDYYVETASQQVGVPVSVGSEGGNNFWNFTQGSTTGTMTEELVDGADSPFPDVFPSANRVSFGPLPFGDAESATWRYDEVSDDAWSMLGFSLGYDTQQVPIDFPVPYQVMPLPLNFGDEWDYSIDMDYPFDPADYGVTLPFDTLIVTFEMGGYFEADAWGKVAIPGAVVPALRVHSQVGGVISAVGITYLGDWRIETPLGDLYTIDASHTYSWHSPGRGEVAYVASMPGEDNPNFTVASIVRRMTAEAAPMVAVTAEPTFEDNVIIPFDGGLFFWDAGIQTFIGSPAVADVWTSATLPNGGSVDIQQVELTLPANANLLFTELEQVIPANAPAGLYEFHLNVGIYPGVVVAHESFPFEKLAGDGADGYGDDNGWTGELPGAQSGSVAEESSVATSATPTEFELGPLYPNPFNAATTVSLTLPQADEVTVRVITLDGRVAQEHALGQVQAGSHRVELDGARLASGVYLVDVTTGMHGRQARKAVLVK